MLTGTKSPLHPTWIRGTQVGKAKKNTMHSKTAMKHPSSNLTAPISLASNLKCHGCGCCNQQKEKAKKARRCISCTVDIWRDGEADEWPEMGGFGG